MRWAAHIAASRTARCPRHGRDLALLLAGILCLHLLAAFASRHGVIRDDAESYVTLGRNIANGFG